MAYGFTATVQAGKMSSQTGFVWSVKTANFPAAAVDGGATSLLNGGGDLRAYTDSSKATQLPLDVVELVTGGSPSVIVFGRSPTLNVASTVYFERDDIAVTQPPVTDTYGRNSVYVDYTHKLDAGALTDTTGATTVSLTTGATQSGLVNGFDAIDIDGSQNACAVFDSTSGENWTSDFTASAWVNLDTFPSFATILGIRESSLWEFHFRCEGNQPAILIGSASPNSTANLSSATDYYLAVTVSGSSIAFYVNGAPAGTASVSGSRNNRSFDLTTGGLKNSSTTDTSIDGRIAESRAINGTALSASRILDEYTNQSDPSTFWSSSAWEDSAGGGVEVSDSLTTTKENSNNDSILAIGEFNILDSTSITKSKSNADSILLSSAVAIQDSKTISKSSVNSDAVLPAGSFSIQDSINTTKTKNNQDSILFSSPIFVNDSVATSKSIVNQDSILFTGEFIVNDSRAITESKNNQDSISFSSVVSIQDSTNKSESTSNADLISLIGSVLVADSTAKTNSQNNSDSVLLAGAVNILDSETITKSNSINDSVIIGELSIIFNPETNFNQPTLSTNISQISLSTNVDQPHLSTNITQ